MATVSVLSGLRVRCTGVCRTPSGCASLRRTRAAGKHSRAEERASLRHHTTLTNFRRAVLHNGARTRCDAHGVVQSTRSLRPWRLTADARRHRHALAPHSSSSSLSNQLRLVEGHQALRRGARRAKMPGRHGASAPTPGLAASRQAAHTKARSSRVEGAHPASGRAWATRSAGGGPASGTNQLGCAPVAALA